MPKRALEEQLLALEVLRAAQDVEALRKALHDRNNYVIARAAAIAADLQTSELVPDLVTAFDRSFVDPLKSDPQCLAKTAVAKALKDLGYHGPTEFLRGIGYVQLEPTWGGQGDTAGTLRGTCALALTECPLDPMEILRYLADGLADPDKVVRIDSAMAIAQLGRAGGAIPLRLKILVGDVESDVLGHCFAALLSVTPADGVALVGRFLDAADQDVQFEAASALAQCREPQAIDLLVQMWQQPLLSTELRRAVLMALGASSVRAAAEFLLTIAEGQSAELASTALDALRVSRYYPEFKSQAAALTAPRP